MRTTTYAFLYWWIIFFSQISYLLSKAMIGKNVKRVSKGQFLAVVSIMVIGDSNVINEDDHVCTGVLITRTHVLSAAHCLKDLYLNETQIIVGSRNVRHGRRYLPLWWITYNKWIKYHNQTRAFRTNDIVVVKLTQNVSNNIDIPLLSYLKPQHLYGLKVTVAARGTTDSGKMSKYLKKIDLTVLTKHECEHRMEILQNVEYFIPIRYLCTYTEPYALMKDGDSGAPVFFMDEIVGIHKAGCHADDISLLPYVVNIHTGIEYYRNFILNVIDSSFHWH